MQLYEYQMKFLLRQANIPVPESEVVSTPEDAYRAAVELGGEVVLKAQHLNNERLPGVTMKMAHTPAGARDIARRMLAEMLGNRAVRQILVEARAQIQHAIYLTIITDYAAGRPILVASLEGGKNPDAMTWDNSDVFSREYINPVRGLHLYQANKIAGDLNFPHSQWRAFVEIIRQLYQCYITNDAEQIEINPLVITPDGHLLVLDGKMRIDPYALYRQPQLATLYDSSYETTAQTQARQMGIQYLALEGQIGCLVNGIGAALTVRGMLRDYGEKIGVKPACVVNVGGSATPEEIADGLRLIFADSAVKIGFINIFDGLMQVDILAHIILQVWHESPRNVPLIVRLQGSNAYEAQQILLGSRIPEIWVEETLSEAVQRVIQVFVGSRAE